MFTKERITFFCWAFYIVFFAVITFQVLIEAVGLNVGEVIPAILGIIGFVGLYGYVAKKNFLNKEFWKVIFLISLIYFIYSLISFEVSRREYGLPFTMYGYYLFMVPELYALFRYASFAKKET